MKIWSVFSLVLPGVNVSLYTGDKNYNSSETTKAINVQINSQGMLAVHLHYAFKMKLQEADILPSPLNPHLCVPKD